VTAFVSELGPHLPDLLRRRRSGVVAALAAAAARVGPGPHQAALVQGLATALGSLPQWAGRAGTAHLAPALLTLDSAVTLGGSSGSSGSSGGGGRLSTPGCALLATLVGGAFPAKTAAPFIASMAQLGRSDVLRVARDPAGSRVLQALLVAPPAQGQQGAAGVSASKKRKQKKKAQRQQQQQQQQEEEHGAAAGGGGDDGGGSSDGGDGSSIVSDARAHVMSCLAGSWGSIALLPAGSYLLEAVHASLVGGAAAGVARASRVGSCCHR
jgi:hypothetical protein